MVHDVGHALGVTNQIRLATRVQPADVKRKVEDALKRDAMLETAGMQVASEERRNILSGQVRSWHERDLAERAAWSAPGVTDVVDRIAVR